MRRLVLPILIVLLLAARAWAVGEEITDVRVQNAVRTGEETVRSIAGVSIGQYLQADTLDVVRERLHTSGLFSDVNVYWEPHKHGVRVNIVISEKFPWAPVPTFSYSPGNISAGGVVAHGNLFGLGKRGVIGGRYSNVDSGAIIAYDDPALFGTWMFFTVKGRFQSVVIPEYSNQPGFAEQLVPMRNTKLRSYGADLNFGVAWFRKIRTSFGWTLDRNDVLWSTSTWTDSIPPESGRSPNAPPPGLLAPAATSARRGIASMNLTFDFRARQHAVMYGNALGFNFDFASRRWGSQDNLHYWKLAVSYEHGIRFFRRHNIILRVGGTMGQDMPLWAENSAGGTNLRGYLYRQFQGDVHIRNQLEYHFPLFSIGALDVRGLVFNDNAAIWFRKLPAIERSGSLDTYQTRSDGRSFLPPYWLRQGFDASQDIHSSAGAGIRFYLHSVAVPLVGVDVGNGIGTKDVRVIIVVGA
jgi:outer membrane protein assembly factor BamA